MRKALTFIAKLIRSNSFLTGYRGAGKALFFVSGKLIFLGLPEMLNRIKIIQRLIRASGAKNYLEIGVNTGACFLRVRAGNKIAVDPSFKIAPGRKLKYFFKNPTNFNNHYFNQTSDDFFSSQAAMLKSNPPKIVFIDGLHTYEQSLQDVINSLKFLAEGGVILMHDCSPLTEAAAYPAKSFDAVAGLSVEGYQGFWNGDVWKTIVHLRSLHPELEVCVIDCDHGVGVVRKGGSGQSLGFSAQQIDNMTFKDLDADRQRLLNLKPPSFLDELARQVKEASRPSPAAVNEKRS